MSGMHFLNRLIFVFIFVATILPATNITADTNYGAIDNSGAKDGETVVRAVVPKLFPPQYSVDNMGNPKGFAIDGAYHNSIRG